MIKLISVNPSGFFGYGLHETIQLDSQGLILLEGLNGSGKSTIIKLIMGELTPESGYINIKDGVRVGYYNQHFDN